MDPTRSVYPMFDRAPSPATLDNLIPRPLLFTPAELIAWILTLRHRMLALYWWIRGFGRLFLRRLYTNKHVLSDDTH
ncbi:unnamed protein product [Nezara viridula]|uniref:Uncharacterized protein n=1 Tax=Nezara viridula TaxID=85310 RepID=A0A9P0E7E4_NEZVI|nr:unnamed protein product [Nezara viridula]